jgi:phage tail tube protein FII
VVVPKNHVGGSIAPAAPTNGSGEYAVRYWATYIDGVKMREIDPLNFICYINGVDYLASVRSVLGK